MAKILIIDNGSKQLDKLKKLLDNHDVTVIKREAIYLPVGNFDLIILSGGGEYSVINDTEVFKKELELIKNVQVPLIGICLGSELVAFAFGATLEKSPVKKRGFVDIKTVGAESPFDKNKTIKVYESHRWSIKELGDNLVGIAKSDDGWEIVKHKIKSIYRLQFHPEMFVDRQAGDEYFRNLFNSLTDP